MKYDNIGIGCLSMIFTWILLILFRTLIFFLFWGWFILPVFPGIPDITFLQSLGLMTFMGVVFKDDLRVKSEDGNLITFILSIVGSIILILGFGYLIHLIVC